jgi:hypothetical protein
MGEARRTGLLGGTPAAKRPWRLASQFPSKLVDFSPSQNSSSQHDYVPPLTHRRTESLFFWIYTNHGDPSDCSSVDHDGCCRRYYNHRNYLRCGVEGAARSQTGVFNLSSYLQMLMFMIIRLHAHSGVSLLQTFIPSSQTNVDSHRNIVKSSKLRQKNESNSSKSHAPN